MNTQDKILIALQYGAEVGLSPMQSIQSVAVINGRPTMWGDAVLAVVLASSVCEYVTESFVGEGDKLTAVCVAKRKGECEPLERRFSVDDAKTAKLWGKRGKEGQDTPWVTYPKRMLQMRARAFCLRDAFADVLRGMQVREELEDYPARAEHSADEVLPLEDE